VEVAAAITADGAVIGNTADAANFAAALADKTAAAADAALLASESGLPSSGVQF
jgi:hypothetical protein